MLSLHARQDPELLRMNLCADVLLSSHSSFSLVYSKMKQWHDRFSFHDEHMLFNELFLFYLLAPKKHLDHRTPLHCFRTVLSIYLLQRQLHHAVTFATAQRHLKIRWIPTELFFPFSSRPVLGCIIGFNSLSRYELFDEENVTLALEKSFPLYQMVQESFYCHSSQKHDIKIYYFEIERRDGMPLSLAERSTLKNSLEEKFKNSIQHLSPAIFTNSNEEEIYKNILALSREISSLNDPPHAYISLDQQSGKEVAFRVILLYSAPYHQFSLKKRFHDCTFISERVFTVRHIDDRPIDAHIFKLLFLRDSSCLRSDGSLDFYAAREKAVAAIRSAIGEFRDYNGGILLKQQELFHDFKHHFPNEDLELLNNFFYTLTPLERRVVLHADPLCKLFSFFRKNKSKKIKKNSYTFHTYSVKSDFYLIIHADGASFVETLTAALQDPIFDNQHTIFNHINTPDGTFFNCLFLQTSEVNAAPLLQVLQKALQRWQQNNKNLQLFRVGAEYLPYSLDPRVGGELVSGSILRLLYEGLTRYDQHGNLENALAQSIEISSDAKQYTFRLRPSLWNDGSAVTAHDFEYAWKKILSPNFKTAFARSFYSIKNAKEAKQGKVGIDEIGIKAIDKQTLKVELNFPVPYFLQLTALPLFSPVHHVIDQQCPQWPYQSNLQYPCNGPFQLHINQPAQCYQLVKNPLYWDAKYVALDQIIIKQMNSHQLLQAFRKNELDWIGNPLGGWSSSYTASDEDRLYTLPSQTACWNIFNTQSSLFKCRKLREAIAFSINREEICKDAPLSITPAYALLSSSPHHHQRSFPKRNVARARKLFEEALEELNISQEEFPPLVLVYHQKGIRQYIANHLKRQLKETLNIECQLDPLPWNKLFERLVDGQFHMGLFHWISPVDDPAFKLNVIQFEKEKTHFIKWDHSELQHLRTQCDEELNPFQRSTYLLQAEKVLSREAPIVPLCFQSSHFLIKEQWDVPYRDAPGFFNFAKIMKHKEQDLERISF